MKRKRDAHRRRKRSGNANEKKGKMGYGSDEEDGESRKGWWMSWLGGDSDLIGSGRDSERVEDRATRRVGMSLGMGGGMGGAGHMSVLDEWGV